MMVTLSYGFLLGITAGPDGNIWFTRTGISPDQLAPDSEYPAPPYLVCELNPTTNALQDFPLPQTMSLPRLAIVLVTGGAIAGAIVAGPGGNLWFADFLIANSSQYVPYLVSLTRRRAR